MEDLSMKTKIIFALITSIILMSIFAACDLEEMKDPITITFDSRGGPKVKSITIERGSSLGGKYPTPKKDDSVFNGWYDEFTECTKDTKIYVDVTLFAHWDDELVTVTFNSNNGTPDFTPIMIPKGGVLGVKFPYNPKRQGYTFLNWAYSKDGISIAVTNDTIITNDLTLMARWRQFTTQYTVTFNCGTGATTLDPIKVYPGDCIDEWENRYSTFIPEYTASVPLPATGRSFKEWIFDPFPDVDDKLPHQNIIYTGRTPVTDNITLVAQWRYVIEETTFTIDLGYCLTIPGDEYTDNVNGTDYTRHRGDNHPLLNFPLPTVTTKGTEGSEDYAYVFTFNGANSAIAIETSEHLRELLTVANSVTVEIDGTAEPNDRLFRILIGNIVTYAEGWNLTKNHSPDPMIPFEDLKKKDLVIDEVNRGNKSDLNTYVVFQTNRIGSTGQSYETPTVATIKSIKITVK
jgi:hypothetical protein